MEGERKREREREGNLLARKVNRECETFSSFTRVAAVAKNASCEPLCFSIFEFFREASLREDFYPLVKQRWGDCINYAVKISVKYIWVNLNYLIE